jgi:FkbM family methyltransferase
MLRYSTRTPDKVHIPGGPVPIHINPADRRARHLIARRSARGKVSTARQLWITAIEHLRPDVAIDVGTNCGECFLGVRYPAHTHVIGIEANPALLPHLQSTMMAHPDRDRIRLVHGLASDTNGVTGDLMVDPTYSGTASAVAAGRPTLCENVTVSSVTMDALIDFVRANHPLSSIVFKMDIEGFEGVAMKGFQRLREIPQRIGILEFDVENLSSSTVKAEELFTMLLAAGDVLDSKHGVRHLRRIECLDHLKAIFVRAKEPLHTDLIVVSPGAIMPAAWRIR